MTRHWKTPRRYRVGAEHGADGVLTDTLGQAAWLAARASRGRRVLVLVERREIWEHGVPGPWRAIPEAELMALVTVRP